MRSFGNVGVVLLALSAAAFADDEEDLSTAAWKGDEATVEKLLRKGTDPNATDKNGVTALILAAHQGHSY